MDTNRIQTRRTENLHWVYAGQIDESIDKESEK